MYSIVFLGLVGVCCLIIFSYVVGYNKGYKCGQTDEEEYGEQYE